MTSSVPRASRAFLLGMVLAAATGCNPLLGPSAPDSNWRAHDRGRFTFHVRPGSFAEQHVDTFSAVLEDQYDYTVSALSLRYAGKISVFLYDSAADAGRESDRSGTAYPDTEAVKAVCTPPLDGNLFALLAHEVNHVILRNGLGRSGTSFVNEGLASTLLSERYHQLGRHHFYPWTAAQAARIPPLSALVDDARWDDGDSNTAYTAGASFLGYLMDTSGVEALRALWPVGSRDFPARFSQIYGRPLEQAEEDWKRFCAGWGS